MTEFTELWNKARAAGLAAGEAAVPRPMIVGSPSTLFGTDVDPTKPTWYEPEGLCGFAWVNVSPATTPFARWLKKTGKVRCRAYRGGYDIWVSDFNQSVARKEAYARAFADVLREAGIKAYAGSRLD